MVELKDEMKVDMTVETKDEKKVVDSAVMKAAMMVGSLVEKKEN